MNVTGTALNESNCFLCREGRLAEVLAFPFEENTIHMVLPSELVHLGAKLMPRPLPALEPSRK